MIENWKSRIPVIIISIFSLIFLIILGNILISSKNINIVIADCPYEQTISVYEQPDEDSDIIAEFCGQTCLTCNLYNENESSADFIAVELGGGTIGYVKKSECYQDILRLDGIEGARQQICRTALTYLGTSYSQMHCTDLVKISYLSIGKEYDDLSALEYNHDSIGKEISIEELQPGDLVFYTGASGIPYGHVGIYLGQGYVIQSTIDKGKEYPTGGVRITKLTFRSSPTIFRSLI